MASRNLVLTVLWLLPALLAGACVDPDGDDSLCPQTYEFGNTGCTLISVSVVGPVDSAKPDFPPGSVLMIHAISITPDEGVLEENAYSDATGDFNLQLTRYTGTRLTAPDTATILVTAQLADARSPVVGSLLPVIAADSDHVLVRVAAVGEKRETFQVALTLKRK
jgi:hypothetical protein